MQNFQLAQARKVMMTELRRAAQGDLPQSLALDQEMLLALVTGGSDSGRGRVLTRALCIRALRELGYTAEDLAPRYGISPEQVERERERVLLADPSIRDAIIDKVLEALPETPEPGRAVAPVGNFAVPGVGYPVDPKLVSQ
ncbi:MAG: hypothetical protein Q8Q14_02935 [Gemmatimonadales bacterium]|nr:hypothetical protein [Gemmatimonadales bacterium]